jgi:hypothetical protein
MLTMAIAGEPATGSSIAGGVADYADWNERDHAALRRR